MSSFNDLCKIMESLDPATYAQVTVAKSADVLVGLRGLTCDGLDAVAIYTDFVLCAVAADGKLSEEEFLLVKPVLDQIADADVSYDEAKAIFKAAGLDKPKEYKAAMDKTVDLLGLVSPELKDDIILVCMLICAVDGKISFREKRWIKKLIA